MGSYGIGPSRLVAAIIEAFHDEDGIKWPEQVAPFHVGLINMKPGDTACDEICEKLYKAIGAAGRDVLYDDTDNRAGAKFATFDLIGLPFQVIAGPRSAAEGKVEVKSRADGSRDTITVEEAINRFGAA